MLDKIKTILPNFPDDVISKWIEPYALRYGWPPSGNDWSGVLSGRLVEFWQGVRWERVAIDLITLKFSQNTLYMNDQLKKTYVLGEVNSFSSLENGRARYERALSYLLQHGKFPVPIFLLKEGSEYSVVDGNHRFLSFSICAEMSPVLTNNSDDKYIEVVASLKRKLGITEIVPFSSVQDVWVAISDSDASSSN